MEDSNTFIKDSLNKLEVIKNAPDTTITTKEDSNSSSLNEIIKTIGSTWPFVLTIFVIVFVIIRWKKIGQMIDRIKSAKIGGQEIEFEKKDNSDNNQKTENEQSIEIQATAEIEVSNDGEKSLYDVRVLYSENKPKEAEKLLEEINNKESNSENVNSNIIISYYLKYLEGYTNSIDELTNFANTQQDNVTKSRAYYFIGECYLFQKNYDSAKTNFEIAYQTLNYSNSDIELSIIVGISNCIENSESLESKLVYLFKELKKEQNKPIILDLYKKIASSTENKLLKGIIHQIILKEKGNDTSILFDTSYQLSEMGENVMAISFYKQLLEINSKDSNTLNNIGVSYDRLNVSSLSNSYYSKSSKAGNTLATANLAFSLIHSGFYDDAETILEKDRLKTDIHNNLIKAINKLKTEREKEELRDKLIDKQANKLRLYFSEISKDVINGHNTILNLGSIEYLSPTNIKVHIESPNTSEIEINWISDDYKYSISLKSNLLYGQAEYKITKENSFSFRPEKAYSGYYCFNNNMSICSLIFYNDEEIIDFKLKKV